MGKSTISMAIFQFALPYFGRFSTDFAVQVWGLPRFQDFRLEDWELEVVQVIDESGGSQSDPLGILSAKWSHVFFLPWNQKCKLTIPWNLDWYLDYLDWSIISHFTIPWHVEYVHLQKWELMQ